MARDPQIPSDETTVRIRRGRVDSVDLYEIKDTELEQLEKGTPADLQLNFAVFLLTLAFSAICALATATTSFDPNTRLVFTVVAVVGTLMGVYLLISWYRTRTPLKELCQRIRSRIPPDVGMLVRAEEPGTEPDEAPRPEP